MIREIVKDEEVLKQKCISVLKGDEEINTIIQDLIDTANFHEDNCIGLTANQIGYNKRIFIIRYENKWLPMVNADFLPLSRKKFISEEGCLSLEGLRKVERYYTINVMYQNAKLKPLRLRLSGIPAVIVQHEIGHTKGQLV
jgi:peptide deformylase